MSLHGSCLCGAVRYEVDRLDGPIVHCHCATCRKAHAAAFNSSAAVERPHFRWTAGEDRLGCHASSPDKNRWFCRACGSQMIAEFPARGHVLLRVATLDEDPGCGRPSTSGPRCTRRGWLMMWRRCVIPDRGPSLIWILVCDRNVPLALRGSWRGGVMQLLLPPDLLTKRYGRTRILDR